MNTLIKRAIQNGLLQYLTNLGLTLDKSLVSKKSFKPMMPMVMQSKILSPPNSNPEILLLLLEQSSPTEQNTDQFIKYENIHK